MRQARSIIGVCSAGASTRPARRCAGSVALVLSLVTSAVGGCATKPPPSHEEILSESALADMGLAEPWRAGGQVGPVLDNWLATFGDPQLDALIAEAMQKNPDLRAAAPRVEQAGQYVELAKAALRPTVSLLGTGGLNMGGGDINSALQGISLGASWEPDLWGRLRYGRNAAEEMYASARADFEFGRQSLAATVAKAWFTSSETWLELQVTEDMVRSAEELLWLTEKRRDVGSGNEQDVALARAALGSFRDSAERVRLAHQHSLRALELLLGRYPGAEIEIGRALPTLPGPVPVGLPLDMLERRPDLMAAERRIAAAFNLVGEAKATRLPRIILNASVSALDSDILELKSDYENPAGGIGARLIAPIYQGGALTAQVEIRTLQQKEAVAEYSRIVFRALGDVENLLAAGGVLDERTSILQGVAADSRTALGLVEAQYRVGVADLRAVQQQQLNTYSADLSLLRVRSEQLARRVDLHLALGGSFEEPIAPEEGEPDAP